MKKIAFLLLFLFCSFYNKAQNTMITDNSDSTRSLYGNWSNAKIWTIKDTLFWNINTNKMKWKHYKYVQPHNTSTLKYFVLSDVDGYSKTIQIDSLTNLKDIRDSLRDRYTKSQINTILNAYMQISIASASFSAMQTQVNGKFNSPTGTIAQYIKGDGSIGTSPTMSLYLTYSDTVGKWMPQGAPYDRSNTNEIQTISLSTNIVSLSSGGSFVIPTQTTGLAPQVNSDWNSVTGVSQISNKPDISLYATLSAINGSVSTLNTSINSKVPLTRNLTINGVTQDLSVDRSFTTITNINLSGTAQSVTRRASGIITPSIANSYSVNISSLGFTNIYNVQCTAKKSTTTAISVPFVAIISVTTSQIVISFIEGVTAVLAGATFTFANTSGLTAYLQIEGN